MGKKDAPGLGLRCAEIDSAVQRMADNPRQFPVVFKTLRHPHRGRRQSGVCFHRRALRDQGIGAAAIGAIELLQLPVEGVIAALLPFIGAAGDLALDSAEAVIGPVLVATILLPHIAPADIVRQIRAERARVS